MHHFFAYLSRMKNIHRWSLMRNTQPQNDAEHSLQVAMLAHGMAVIAVKRYGRAVDPEHVATLAIYHDAAEVMTGDIPTPVKYQSQALREAFRKVQEEAGSRLIAMLPLDLQPEFIPYLNTGEDEAHRIVKAADKLSAYIKCLEEQRAGNHEFDAAAEKILRSIHAMQLPEAEDMLKEFIPSFTMTLDELNKPE